MLPESKITELRTYLLELAHLDSVSALLDWDQSVNMPTNHNGHQARAALSAYMAGLRHRKATSPEFENLLLEAKLKASDGQLDADEKCIVTEAWDDFERNKKLPPDFVEEQTRMTGKAQQAWETAKDKSDFKLFKPHLEEIVALKRQEADYSRESGQDLYDALLDNYEPGFPSARLEIIFKEVKDFLLSFIQILPRSPHWTKSDVVRKPIVPLDQMKFAKMVARKIGYKVNSGNLAISVHPFSTSFHPTDARITTRCKRRNFVYDCLMSVIHESGHAMYEQGLPTEFYGTPRAEAVSFGIHESQSRLWENIVGRSMPFWIYFYPKMQHKIRQFRNVSLADFYGAINHVQSSFIRVDADEVTYNLHIILRFEIERMLINGQVEVDDLPDLWNQKAKEYLGLTVSSDSDGILQDVHWSDGSFGYFPSYALGNLYAAQFYEAAERDMPELNLKISKGNFRDLLRWLRSNIHVHGRLYSAEELLERVTDKGCNTESFIKYIREKYASLYGIQD